ncbi:hypothetical protein EDB81DRAFT_204347 [Dactylonectria macrodidyma]|uniref:Uncharacterized protein n=1 Tax=Dactylonectria macrodidyma TaxID=307937 RepID=A0A9P9DT74_9HYPO|nr:hypothetical protein EDB81DRAFT_204347 [Dactylonectria macrodidyma]
MADMSVTNYLEHFKPGNVRAREAEYQSLWQACERTSRKDEYLVADMPIRLALLRNSLTKLLEKRRNDGKQMCNIDVDQMIERHLKREAQQRRFKSKRKNRVRGHSEEYNDNEALSPMALAPAPVPQAQGPPPVIKYDQTPHYPLPAKDGTGPAEYLPQILDNGHSNTTLFNELAACRADRCALWRRVGDLEEQLAQTAHIASILFAERHPDIMAMPQTPDTMDMAGHDDMLQGGDI